jgi:hypothetical protein
VSFSLPANKVQAAASQRALRTAKADLARLPLSGDFFAVIVGRAPVSLIRLIPYFTW